MKKSLLLLVVVSAITASASEIVLEQKTFFGGGTEPSTDGKWAPAAFNERHLAPSAVPEPKTAMVAAVGAGLLGLRRRPATPARLAPRR